MTRSHGRRPGRDAGDIRRLLLLLALTGGADVLRANPLHAEPASTLVTCGPASARAHGILCGPANNPCVIHRNEVVAGSTGFRNEGPDLAVNSLDDALIFYPVAEGGFTGFLVRSHEGVPLVANAIPPDAAVGAITLDADDQLFAMTYDGYASRLWRRDVGDWDLLYRSIPTIRAGRPQSLRRDDAGCFHVGATIDDAPAYLRLADRWTYLPLTEEPGSEPVVAVAPSGQPHLAYFTTEGTTAQLFWVAPPQRPEFVLPLNVRGERRYPAALAVTGADNGSPHILTLQYSPDHTRVAVVHAARHGDGSWAVQALAEESGLDPYGQALCPTCVAVPEEGETCRCSYAAVRPLTIAASGAELRMFYSRYDVTLDLHGYCNARPQVVCEWTGSRQVAGSIVMAWPSTSGLVQETVLDGVLPSTGTAGVDSRGEIHLALLDRGEIRYVLIAGAAAEACPADCDLDGHVTIDELLTGVNIALDGDSLGRCPAADTDFDGHVGIDELLAGVSGALQGCPARQDSSTKYILDGSLNDSPTTGTMILRELPTVEPNLVRYEVSTFAFSALSGSGTAEFFTLNNTLTLDVSVSFPEQDHVALHGTAAVLPTSPLSFGEFHLTAPGYDLRFSAQRDDGAS